MKAWVPISYFILSSFTSLIALNTPQKSRITLFPLLATFSFLAFSRVQDVSSSHTVNSVLALFVLIWFAQISCALYVEQHALSKVGNFPSWDWSGAYKMWVNPRRIGTERQAPDVQAPKHSSTTTSEMEDSARSSTHWKFLLSRLSSIVLIFILNHFYSRLFFDPHPDVFTPMSYSDFTAEKRTYLRRLIFGTVTPRESIIRSFLAFHWIWSAWAVFTGIHDALAIFFVGVLGVDEPEEWPPLFGSLAEAYTLRRFWGKFWHRIVYRTYVSYGSLILRKVFGVRRSSPLHHALVNFMVFLFSGLAHEIVNWQLGYRCGFGSDVVWFCLNFGAIMLEDSMERAAKIFLHERRISEIKRHRTICRGAGFAWVILFFFWSMPKQYYPRMHCGK